MDNTLSSFEADFANTYQSYFGDLLEGRIHALIHPKQKLQN